jgi:hypothetical protein
MNKIRNVIELLAALKEWGYADIDLDTDYEYPDHYAHYYIVRLTPKGNFERIGEVHIGNKAHKCELGFTITLEEHIQDDAQLHVRYYDILDIMLQLFKMNREYLKAIN